MELTRNLLAFVIGAAIGSGVYVLVISVGSLMFPPPPGMDPQNQDSVAAAVHLLETQHYVVRFLAHASATLVAAMVAYIIAGRHRNAVVYAIGFFFLSIALLAAQKIPAPTLFIAIDLVIAYIPMALIGGNIARQMVGGGR